MSDEADRALTEQGEALADAILAALPGWGRRVVAAHRPDLADEGGRAGEDAAAALGPRLRVLLAADVDEQRANPLAIVRQAVAWPTEVLRRAGVAPVERDDFDRSHFPDDDYDLSPRTFADVDESLQEAGIVWGAMKAHAHLVRHERRA